MITHLEFREILNVLDRIYETRVIVFHRHRDTINYLHHYFI